MAIDRTAKLYVVYDLRITPNGMNDGTRALRPLWRKRAFWNRGDAIATRLGFLLGEAQFQLPGFHSVYFVPTAGRLRMLPMMDPEFCWWFREVEVPIDLAAWKKAAAQPSGIDADRLFIDMLERGLLAFAKKHRTASTIVRELAQTLRVKGEDALVPIQSVTNRYGSARVDLRVAVARSRCELIVTVKSAAEPGVTRRARLRLRQAGHVAVLCRGIKLSEEEVELTRTGSLRTRVFSEGYPRRLRFRIRKMPVVQDGE